MNESAIESVRENVEISDQQQTVTENKPEEIPVWEELILKLVALPGIKTLDDIEAYINECFEASLTEVVTSNILTELLSMSRSNIEQGSRNKDSISCTQLLNIIKDLPSATPKTRRRGRLV